MTNRQGAPGNEAFVMHATPSCVMQLMFRSRLRIRGNVVLHVIRISPNVHVEKPEKRGHDSFSGAESIRSLVCSGCQAAVRGG
jgi:hypothetical protein